MSASTKAIFLSYAREDAASARRIAEALRAAGLEVWFDENELRGGDAWDAKIRQQIDACALFIPIVSQHTQSRGKGYFRLEWKLAVEQTHLMAEGMAYLAPVVIDDTKESGALVPPEFMKVQWTRLPGALPTPQFVEQVKRLLQGGTKVQGSELKGPRSEESAPRPVSGATPRRSRFPGWAWGALGVAVAGVVAGVVLLRPPAATSPAAASARESKPAVANPAASTSPQESVPAPAAGTSVAVLPFANLSGDPAQEYFSDGLTEEILNSLARERDLRVPGRASSFSFKGRNASAAEIAQALGVSRLVEGSVRKSGNKVRISVQLTRASDGFSEELGTFTEELTDVFALQDKIARTVVEKVTARRSTAAVTAVPTRNPEAYDAYLKGRSLQTRSADGAAKAASYYEQAVAIDPDFALAWARLAEARFRPWGAGSDRSPALAAATRVAIDRALELQPNLPEALVMRANWLRGVKGDFAGAEADLNRAEALQPANSGLRQAQALLARARSDWPEAFRRAEECLALDPQNGDYTNAFAVGFYLLRGRYEETDRLLARAVAIQGSSSAVPLNNRAQLHEWWVGPGAGLNLLGHSPADSLAAEVSRIALLINSGRTEEARSRVDQLLSESQLKDSVTALAPRRNFSPNQLAAVGLRDLARQRAEEIREETMRELARENRSPNVLSAFISAEIYLGRNDVALELLNEWQKAASLQPSDYVRLTEFNRRAAELFARLGLADRAFALLEEFFDAGYRAGFGLSGLGSLRDTPRVQALLRRYEGPLRSQSKTDSP